MVNELFGGTEKSLNFHHLQMVKNMEGGGSQSNILSLHSIQTRLPASRSSSIGPEGRFLFLYPKVKVKERIFLRSTSL